MSIDLQEMLTVARDAVDLARQVLAETTVNAVRSKHDRDLVSNVDLTIEREVRDVLGRQTPSVGFVGEEEGSDGAVVDTTWILDPIDGTSNFLHGIPLYGISLALVEERQPVLGVIALPALNSVYYGASGSGAFKDGRPIHVRDTSRLTESIVSIGDYAVGDGADERNTPRLALTAKLARSAERVRMFGSAAVDMAWLAEGRTDAAIALSNSAWDFTAGVAIGREAGADVRELDGSEHSLDAQGVVATAPGVAGELVELTREAASG